MTDVQPTLYPDLIGFKHRLPHLTESLARQSKVKIVAIGSSSTAGADEVVPFPPRLEQALRTRFYGRAIDVVNRGIGGQEAPEELARFQSDVLAEAPALVIWQVGTNAVYQQCDYKPFHGFDDVEDAIAVGLGWLATLPTDVILMDLQFTQTMVTVNCGSAANGHIGPNGMNMGFADDIELRIARAAARAGIDVFRRWALMKRWCDDGIPLSQMDDGGDLHLHTGEWATKWVTIALDRAIGAAVGPVRGARHRPFDI
jgi:acyl-CoA thioesterase-1